MTSRDRVPRDRARRSGSGVGATSALDTVADDGTPTRIPRGSRTDRTPSSRTRVGSDIVSENTFVRLPSLPEVPASNYVHIERKGWKALEQFVIDPTMPMPASFFEPVGAPTRSEESRIQKDGSAASNASLDDGYLLKDGKPRPNLALQSNKGIQAEVWLVDSDVVAAKQKKVLVDLLVTGRASNVVTDAKIIAQRHQLFNLDITHSSANGTIRIWIAESFVGQVTIDNGNVTTSPEVKQKFSVISEVGNKHRCFIGDIRSFTESATFYKNVICSYV